MLCLVIQQQRSKTVTALLRNEFCSPFIIKFPAVHLWLRSVLILFKVFPSKTERNDLSTGAGFISQIPFRLTLWLHVNHLDVQYLVSTFFFNRKNKISPLFAHLHDEFFRTMTHLVQLASNTNPSNLCLSKKTQIEVKPGDECCLDEEFNLCLALLSWW